MGDRNGATACDLLLEARDDASGAAKNIAEAHDDELGRPILEALAHHLRHPLRRPHDIGGVDRLVGRHEDELLDFGSRGGAGEHPGSVGVVANGLPGVGLFHERNVLVGRRVENHAGSLAREHLFHQGGVLGVAHEGGQRNPRSLVLQGLLNLI